MDKVLVVDDNADVLASLSEGLEIYQSQFDVVTASDGAEAIKILNRDSISLVVTDLMMPKVGGLQLIAYMTRNFPATPLVVMTGYGTADIRDNLIQGGVLRYIEKPFNLKELAAAVIEGLDLLDEGASLMGVSVSNFLPLIEMEQVTCLLQISSANTGKGLFYFEKGVLFDASFNKMKPESAAVEMLTWEKVEISFLSIPKKKMEQRIFSDLMTLVAEAGRLKEKRLAQDSPGSAASAEEPVPEVSLAPADDTIQEDEPLRAEVIIQDDGGGEVEQELFLDIRPGREDIFNEKMNKFRYIDGFIAVGVFSSGGELVSGAYDLSTQFGKIGDYIFDVMRKASGMLALLKFGECGMIDITAAGGEHFIFTCCSRKGIDYAVLLVCSQQAELGLFKHRLGFIAPTLSEDLKIR